MTASSPDKSFSEKLPASIVPTAGEAAREIVAPLDLNRLAEQFRFFEEFKSRLLKSDDYQRIGEKQFIKKSGWRKYALACNVSDELVDQERVPMQGRDAEGGFYYRIVARAYHQPTGRSSIGTAVASSAERKNWTHEEHDVYTLAHTRAKNRAISDLVGGGEVSAEELSTDSTSTIANVRGEMDQKLGTSFEEKESSDTGSTTLWRVPIGREPVEGITQYPVTSKGGRTFGICNVDVANGEAACIPDGRVKGDAAPLRSFLVGKFLEGLKTKRRIEYEVRVDHDGYLVAVLVRPVPDADSLGELLTASAWTFDKARDGS